MDKLRTNYMIDTLEACLHMNYVEKSNLCWRMFIDDELLIEADKNAERIIKEIKPDFRKLIYEFRSIQILSIVFTKKKNNKLFSFMRSKFPFTCDAEM